MRGWYGRFGGASQSSITSAMVSGRPSSKFDFGAKHFLLVPLVSSSRRLKSFLEIHVLLVAVMQDVLDQLPNDKLWMLHTLHVEHVTIHCHASISRPTLNVLLC